MTAGVLALRRIGDMRSVGNHRGSPFGGLIKRFLSLPRSGRANFDDRKPAGELAENFGSRVTSWHKHAELPGNHFREKPHGPQAGHHPLGKVTQLDTIFRRHARAPEFEPVLQDDGGIVVDEGGPGICWPCYHGWCLDESLGPLLGNDPANNPLTVIRFEAADLRGFGWQLFPDRQQEPCHDVE